MDVNSISSKADLRSRPLIFLDLETTGFSVQRHEILEIGAWKVDPRKPFPQREKFCIKVRPQNLETADKIALKIVKFNEEDWKDAITLKEGLKQLKVFGMEGVLVGYNVNFDWAFLNRAYFLQGENDPFYYHRLDVMSMAYKTLYVKRSLRRFSLGEVCKYLGIERGREHSALDDAYATYLVFKKLFEYT